MVAAIFAELAKIIITRHKESEENIDLIIKNQKRSIDKPVSFVWYFRISPGF